MEGRRDRIRTATDALCVACFALLLLLPLAGSVFQWHPYSRIGRWIAVRKPWPELQPLRSYPGRFSEHFADQLGFRDLMIRWNNVVSAVWLGSAPNNRIRDNTNLEVDDVPAAWGGGRVFLGVDDWFFYFRTRSIDSYRGVDPMSDQELSLWKHHFENRRRQLARRGIDYLLVIAPEKQSVYPSRMPWALRAVSGTTRTDQLVEYLGTHPALDVLDLRPVLRRARGERDLYYRTGTHWNQLGAHVAYEAILEALRARGYPMEPAPLSDFDVSEHEGRGRGLPLSLRIEDLFPEHYVDLVPHRPRTARTVKPPGEPGPDGVPRWKGETMERATDREELPRAVVLHDSFVAAELEPFLSEHFESVRYVWKVNPPTDSFLDARPDLVLELRSERLFDDMVPNGRGQLVQRPDARTSAGHPSHLPGVEALETR